MSDGGVEAASPLPAAKAALRARLRQLRRALPAAQREAETSATVSYLTNWLLADDRPLAGTWVGGSELDLAAFHEAVWRWGRPVWLPRVCAERRLAWHPVTSLAQLVPGAHGLREPGSGLASVAKLPPGVRLLVPGLGFGPDGRRLGQGGGYFDAVLSELPAEAVAIGVGFTCQWCPDLPEEAHDRRVHAVLLGGCLRVPSLTSGG